jgi:preprotein translocase subunit YajC
MWTDAFAQAGGSAPPDPKISMLLQLLQVLPLFIILYLLLIRPQQQQRKKLNEMLKALKKGDRVLTTGGIFGTVIGVDDAKAVLKIADDVKVEFSKNAIVQVLAAEVK